MTYGEYKKTPPHSHKNNNSSQLCGKLFWKVFTKCALLNEDPSSTLKRWENMMKTSSLHCLDLPWEAGRHPGVSSAACLLRNSHVCPISWEIPSSGGGRKKGLSPFSGQKKLTLIFNNARNCLSSPDFFSSPAFIISRLGYHKGRAKGAKRWCWLRSTGAKSRWR